MVVISGDGDATAIGGNHLIHAARRNIGIKMILINNGIYGMTGGQVSPLTPPKFFTETTPYGNIEPNFNVRRRCSPPPRPRSSPGRRSTA